MTAKELRQAAEYAVTQWDRHDSKRLVQGEEAFLNEDGEPDTVTFARHILSTVREDDDEPVSKEWFEEVIGDPLDLQTMEPWFIWWHSTRGILMGPEGGSVGPEPLTLPIKTRGQFRSLCVGLGIVLEEGT